MTGLNVAKGTHVCLKKKAGCQQQAPPHVWPLGVPVIGMSTLLHSSAFETQSKRIATMRYLSHPQLPQSVLHQLKRFRLDRHAENLAQICVCWKVCVSVRVVRRLPRLHIREFVHALDYPAIMLIRPRITQVVVEVRLPVAERSSRQQALRTVQHSFGQVVTIRMLFFP